MLREKEICNTIRTAYLYLFFSKKERKQALSRLNMELVAQSVRYRGKTVLAYQTSGSHECSLKSLRISCQLFLYHTIITSLSFLDTVSVTSLYILSDTGSA